MDGEAVKSALCASMTVSITRGISTNCMAVGHGEKRRQWLYLRYRLHVNQSATCNSEGHLVGDTDLARDVAINELLQEYRTMVGHSTVTKNRTNHTQQI